MRTVEDAKKDLLEVMKYIRYAIEVASERGSPQFAVISNHPDGGGAIECRFDCQFIEDVAMLIGAEPMTEEDRKIAKLAHLMDRVNKAVVV